MSEGVLVAIIGGVFAVAVAATQVVGIIMNSRQHGRAVDKLGEVATEMRDVKADLRDVKNDVRAVKDDVREVNGRVEILESIRVSQYGSSAVVEVAEGVVR